MGLDFVGDGDNVIREGAEDYGVTGGRETNLQWCAGFAWRHYLGCIKVFVGLLEAAIQLLKHPTASMKTSVGHGKWGLR